MDDERNTHRNWLHRLRHLSLSSWSANHRNEHNLQSVGDGAELRRSSTLSSEGYSSSCSKRKNSFRRGLKKMHVRMKSYITGNNSRTTINSPVVDYSSSSSERNSRRISSDNIYSTDPTLLSRQSATSSPNDAGSSQQIAPTFGDYDSPPVAARMEQGGSGQHPECMGRVATEEIKNLATAYWYWGPLTRGEAERKLQAAPDGAFLVRDSCNSNYVFTISFRSFGVTMHTRIEYRCGRYTLYDQEGFRSIRELVDNAMSKSVRGVYCYSTGCLNNSNFPVRFLVPVSRYTHVPTLKHLCRFVIRQCTNINDIAVLPIPLELEHYLRQSQYF